MDASHILVGGLTGVTIAFLVWIEIHSRRNNVVQEHISIPPELPEVRTLPKKKRP